MTTIILIISICFGIVGIISKHTKRIMMRSATPAPNELAIQKFPGLNSCQLLYPITCKEIITFATSDPTTATTIASVGYSVKSNPEITPIIHNINWKNLFIFFYFFVWHIFICYIIYIVYRKSTIKNNI